MTENYDYEATKIVSVLSNCMDVGTALNVLGHMCISIGRYADAELMGRAALIDASGIVHLGIAKYPLIVTQVKPSTVRKAVEAARLVPNIYLATFPRQMLEMGHDDELAGALTQVDEASLEYLGAVLYGSAADVNQITRKYSLYR